MTNLILYENEIEIRASLVNKLSDNTWIGDILVASSKSEIINILWFSGGNSYVSNFQNLVIGIDSFDAEILNFIRFIMRNKPEIRIFLYASSGGRWIENLPLFIEISPYVVKTSVKTINTDFLNSLKSGMPLSFQP